MPDILELPRENDDYIPLTGITLDSTPTTSIEVGYAPLGQRPVTNWQPYPGPKAPTTPGYYLVLIRETGGGAADEVGFLHIL